GWDSLAARGGRRGGLVARVHLRRHRELHPHPAHPRRYPDCLESAQPAAHRL
ncbi:MAG: hypothetical protein AVDCRST_MAG88-2641, partial [uncultured Thermomicrobiales bacterium]